MKIPIANYNLYVHLCQLVKKRIKQDKEFVKLVHKMIQTKDLTPSDIKRMDELIGVKPKDDSTHIANIPKINDKDAPQ